ncbi:MAG: hypothetical protein HY918_01270 [Candidatus Doudnabacteria bacterium]|nr:hypothetical protein [Candidatus Doudnabacteria bacterium]
MTSPEKGSSPEFSELIPGTPVRIKGTSEHHINHEFLLNGITGVVVEVKNDKVFVAYRIPGDSIRRDKAQETIQPFDRSEIEEIIS